MHDNSPKHREKTTRNPREIALLMGIQVFSSHSPLTTEFRSNRANRILSRFLSGTLPKKVSQAHSGELREANRSVLSRDSPDSGILRKPWVKVVIRDSLKGLGSRLNASTRFHTFS